MSSVRFFHSLISIKSEAPSWGLGLGRVVIVVVVVVVVVVIVVVVVGVGSVVLCSVV